MRLEKNKIPRSSAMKIYLVIECDTELNHDVNGKTFNEVHKIIMKQALETNEPGTQLVACYAELPKVESAKTAGLPSQPEHLQQIKPKMPEWEIVKESVERKLSFSIHKQGIDVAVGGARAAYDFITHHFEH
jgi:hypothetical protein